MTHTEIRCRINGYGRIGDMASKDHTANCLIIGANGLIGSRLGKILDDRRIGWEGTCNKRAFESLLKLDITNPGEVKSVFSKTSPKTVFHCANLAGGVDFCESNPGLARDFYLNATVDIGRRCQSLDSTFVFISTDYVFDGTKGPYREEDTVDPLNLYGRLKFDAEEWVRNNLEKYIIVRTTNVYGWDPLTLTPNYMMSMYRAVKDKKPFNAPSFLWGNPTYVGDLAEAIIELLFSGVRGIFHVVGPSYVNRFDWARQACGIFGLNAALLNEIKEPAAKMIPRPLKSRLNTDKFTRLCKTVLHDLASGLRLMKRDMDRDILKDGKTSI